MARRVRWAVVATSGVLVTGSLFGLTTATASHAAVPSSCSSTTSTCIATFTASNASSPASFTVPANVTSLSLTVSGASGGSAAGNPGGLGGTSVGRIEVSPGQVLSALVGAGGGSAGAADAGAGGGASYVFDGNVILAAGGGGGAGPAGAGGAGGDAVDPAGQGADSGDGSGGSAATPTGAGASGGLGSGIGTGPATTGAVGVGGAGGPAIDPSSAGGGGGGGYFGGGGGGGEPAPVVTPTPTQTPTQTPSSPTDTDSPTPTDSDSPTDTDSPSPTDSPTPTDSATPTDTTSPTDTDSPTDSDTTSPTDTDSATPTDTYSPTDTDSATPTDTDSPSPSASSTPGHTKGRAATPARRLPAGVTGGGAGGGGGSGFAAASVGFDPAHSCAGCSSTPSVTITYDYAFPSATSTGYPAGTTLTMRKGNLKLGPNAVISGMHIVGCITVAGSNVKVIDSLIECPTKKPAINIALNALGTVIDYDEINGDGQSQIGIAGKNFTADHDNIYAVGDGIHVGTHATVNECYIHDLGHQPGLHHDALQTVQNSKGSNMLIEHNTLLDYAASTATNGNSAYHIGSGDLAHIFFQDNYVDGGQYTIQVDNGAQQSDIEITDNAFGSHAKYGPITVNKGSAVTFVGNYYVQGDVPIAYPAKS